MSADAKLFAELGKLEDSRRDIERGIAVESSLPTRGNAERLRSPARLAALMARRAQIHEEIARWKEAHSEWLASHGTLDSEPQAQDWRANF